MIYVAASPAPRIERADAGPPTRSFMSHRFFALARSRFRPTMKMRFRADDARLAFSMAMLAASHGKR